MQRPSGERLLLAALGAITSVASTAFLIIRPVQLPAWLPGGASPPSSVSVNPPAAGTGTDDPFSVTPGDSQVTITWPTADAMRLYRAGAVAEAGVPSEVPCDVTAAPSIHSTRCVVSGLRNGLSYLVSVYPADGGDAALPLRTVRIVPRPAVLSSPSVVTWLDASDYTTIETDRQEPAAIGSRVLALHDRSPHQRAVVQQEAAREPTIGQLGRLPALDLDGTDVLTTDDRGFPAADTPSTVVVAAAQDDPSPDTACFHNLLSWGTGTPGHARIIHKGCQTPLAFAETFSTWAEQEPTQAWPTGRPAVLSAVFEADDTTVRLDGTPSYRWKAPRDLRMDTESSGVLSLGGAAWDAQAGWKGRIGEVIVFDRVLTPPDLHEVEAYLAAKWQVTLNAA